MNSYHERFSMNSYHERFECPIYSIGIAMVDRVGYTSVAYKPIPYATFRLYTAKVLDPLSFVEMEFRCSVCLISVGINRRGSRSYWSCDKVRDFLGL